MNRVTDDEKKTHGLKKSEIIRGYNAFARILRERKIVSKDRLRCYFTVHRSIPPYECKVGFTVKGARTNVQRNRVKRLMREAYRLQKQGIHEFCHRYGLSLSCVFLYDERENDSPPRFHEIKRSMSDILEALQGRVIRT